MLVEHEKRAVTLLACLVVSVLFALACALPAVGTCQLDGSVHEAGIQGLFFLPDGWLGVIFGIFGWYANPLLLNGLTRLACNKFPGVIRSGLAVALGATSFLYARSFNYLDDEADSLHLCHPQIGYFLWMAALVIQFGIALLQFKRIRELLNIALVD